VRGYEEPSFFPFFYRPLLLSQSWYFWPLGMVAPLRERGSFKGAGLLL
jgi:hypothetical protein